ncbi:MAG: thioredoxin family protein, partial [Planctomycetota bacterium]
MTPDEFGALLDGDADVLLVEFCVPTGCLRCDQMREPIDRLANVRRDQLQVRRLNLSRQPALAWEFGVTVCPSYVAFRGGEEV